MADTNWIRVSSHLLPVWPPDVRGQEELRVSLGRPAEDAGASGWSGGAVTELHAQGQPVECTRVWTTKQDWGAVPDEESES